MYHIELIDKFYCIYESITNKLIAQFSRLIDATYYIQSISGIVIVRNTDSVEFINAQREENNQEFLGIVNAQGIIVNQDRFKDKLKYVETKKSYFEENQQINNQENKKNISSQITDKEIIDEKIEFKKTIEELKIKEEEKKFLEFDELNKKVNNFLEEKNYLVENDKQIKLINKKIKKVRK
ncbi:hypothetical protein SDIMI_v3c05760 [Spiroplasma diminutum CUAS-1]|uniref:Uncharacterized protein n=2 Tax=Spiroplasma diminutum TaxID=216936 RepID=S5MJZ3_9MOLU|nr:hypothetical protein SDIMI_v3c05760 [Spiroplasma diminutum CUAS-1]